MRAAAATSARSDDLPEVGKERHGQIYSWGFCTHGQLGLKETILGAREYVEVPTHAGPGSVLRDVELRTSSCGHFHTLAVDVHGNVFAFGRNDRGQLGCGCDDEEVEVAARTGAVPRRVRSLARVIITDISCGAFHCLARTADGTLMSWGWNQHGQLGRLTPYQTDSVPALVQEAKGCSGAFRSFAAGFSHSAGVLYSGQVLAWGSNECGQLGVGSAVRHPEVAKIPIPVPEIVGEQVAAGDNHLIVLTFDGHVVAAGDSSFGRLGIGVEDRETAKERGGLFAPVHRLPWSEDPKRERMSFVACGGATSAAISTHGRLFTWGGGAWGQLGLGCRSDRDEPAVVTSLQSVSHVDIAQDHMLAVCKRVRRVPKIVDDDNDGACSDEDVHTSATLWAWGRRGLLPSGLGCRSDDREAQCVPAEVPLDMLGCLGALCANGAKVDIFATCGGSHSIVLGTPTVSKSKSKHYGAARCPRFSTVTGPGTKGGAISESLAFQIVSRDADGRNETVGGLRFCVWASPISSTRPRRPSKSDISNVWDKHPFELQRIIDRRDGTYDGAYIVRRPGAYFLHVHMLRPDEEVDMNADLSKLEPGDPVSGSPFQVNIDSCAAFAKNCMLELRAARRRRYEARPDMATATGREMLAQEFTIEASSEAIWDITAYDIFGNALTFSTDIFTACIDRDSIEAEAEALAAPADLDLADCLGLPKVSSGRSTAGDALRERVRQRKAEKIWTNMSSNFTRHLGVAASKKSKHVSLHVRQSKEPGRKEIRWTPDAVGHYKLEVSLSNSDASSEEPVKGSPFKVLVVPGQPSPSNSKILVGEAAVRLPGAAKRSADSNGSIPDEKQILMSSESPPQADVPVRLLLCDRMGNVCQETVDALKFINVRIENVRILGCATQGSPGKTLLESCVVPGNSKGLLALKLKATSELLSLVARAATQGEIKETCVIQLFVSASDRTSRERLSGSPVRLQLEMAASSWTSAMLATPTPLVESKPSPEDTSSLLVGSSAAKVEIKDASESACLEVSSQPPLEDTMSDNVGVLKLDAVRENADEGQGKQVEAEMVSKLDMPTTARSIDALRAMCAQELKEVLHPSSVAAQASRCEEETQRGSPGRSVVGQATTEMGEPPIRPDSAHDQHTFQNVPSLISTAVGLITKAVAAKSTSDNDYEHIGIRSIPAVGVQNHDPIDAVAAVLHCSTTASPTLTPTVSPHFTRPQSPASPPRARNGLLSSSSGSSYRGWTPPGGEDESLERRAVVQLPPISPASHSPAAALSEPLDRKESARSTVMEIPENASTSRPASHSLSFRTQAVVTSKAEGRAGVDSMSWIPGSGLSAAECFPSSPSTSALLQQKNTRRSNSQAHVQHASDRRRRSPVGSLSAGLIRAGPLTVAPSPWPQPKSKVR